MNYVKQEITWIPMKIEHPNKHEDVLITNGKDVTVGRLERFGRHPEFVPSSEVSAEEFGGGVEFNHGWQLEKITHWARIKPPTV